MTTIPTTPKWMAGWGTPGQPADDTIECDEWQEAAEALHEELTERIDSDEATRGHFTATSLRSVGTDLLEAEEGKDFDASTGATEYWVHAVVV